MSIKYVCDVCGLSSSHGRIEPCNVTGCSGTMRRVKYKFHAEPKKCVVCGKLFVPTRGTQKTCGGECGRRLDGMRSLRKRRKPTDESRAFVKRYNDNAERGKKVRYVSTRRPWFWLEATEDGRGKRTILHTLEELTESGTFPWPDVLAGTMPHVGDLPACGSRRASR